LAEVLDESTKAYSKQVNKMKRVARFFPRLRNESRPIRLITLVEFERSARSRARFLRWNEGMNFEEASSVAVNATAVLSAILNKWIVTGQIIFLMPVASFGESEDSHSPSVEVHVLPDIPHEVRIDIIHAVQPIVQTGVPVTVVSSPTFKDAPPLFDTLH
jgi:hypothetical protein